MTASKPMPCPFCGGKDNIPLGPDGILTLVHGYSSVKDTDCPLRGLNLPTEWWNRRPAPPSETVRAPVGELRLYEGRVSFHTLVPVEKLVAGPLYASPPPGYQDAEADELVEDLCAWFLTDFSLHTPLIKNGAKEIIRKHSPAPGMVPELKKLVVAWTDSKKHLGQSSYEEGMQDAKNICSEQLEAALKASRE